MLQWHLFLSAPDRSVQMEEEQEGDVEDSRSVDSVVVRFDSGSGRCSVEVDGDQQHHVKASGL